MTQRAIIYSEPTPQWYDSKRAREIMEAYNSGASSNQPADEFVACSIIPAGSGSYRDFSYIAPDLPEFKSENCVACMECVQNCPDSAIWGRVITPDGVEATLGSFAPETQAVLRDQLVQTTKYWKTYQKKHESDPSSPEGAWFGI
ncbi:MAG: 4Fe-4S binding protein, partial [Magnetococcales bacterium]|nr:4Fe-4S binding protein [Magnetococcales bacterium]